MSPEGAALAVVAAGLVGYALADDDDCHKRYKHERYRNDCYRRGYYGGGYYGQPRGCRY